jgi:hypothetical protein
MGRMLRRALLAASLAAALAVPATVAAAPVTRLHLGDTFIVSGQTGSLRGHVRRAVGLVVVRARWDGERWRVLTSTRTDANGRCRFQVRPHRRGVLTLAVGTPDRHERRFVLHVL